MWQNIFNWNIKIDKENQTIINVNGEDKICFIGYECAKRQLAKYEYAKKKITDNDCYRISFKPEPDFISFSFIQGFFEDSIQSCIEKIAKLHSEKGNNKKLTRAEFKKAFKGKFDFEFLEGKLDKEEIYKHITVIFEDRVFNYENKKKRWGKK